MLVEAGVDQRSETGTPLTRVRKGRSVVVVSLRHASSHERGKLMSLGIMPGATVHLQQRFPSYVLGIGYTQVALDRETAGMIFVADEIGTSGGRH
jgi:ferrous iron transport protein A